MATSIYLDSVLKVLPAIQARQITALMNDLQVSGEVKNADEYRSKLYELSTLVNDSLPVPSFKQIRSFMWHLALSAAHNEMMKALKNDLEAIFIQVDDISKRINDHHFLIMKNLAADLERGLADQENVIRQAEWLASQNNEFTVALANSFISASLLKVPRTQFGSDSLYFDNRTYVNKTEVDLPSASVSEYGQKLILDVENDPVEYPIAVIQKNDASSYGTEIAVDIENDINNIIDGTRGTYWTRNVYLYSSVPKVTTVLEFDFGISKDVNYVIIEGATEEEFKIESLKGIAADGHEIELLNNTISISGRTRIDFERCFVKSVRATFANYSYRRAEYYVPYDSPLHDALNPINAFNKITITDALGPIVHEVLASEKLATVCNVPTSSPLQINAYLYSFALDNVWFGNSKYIDTGIFVSKPLSVTDIGLLAVKATENIGSNLVKNSIEYEIIKIDKYPHYKESKFPIPKLNQTEIEHERLILTKKEDTSDINDTGMLRFCPYVDPLYDPLTDESPVKVYKNGIELNLGTDYSIAISTISFASGMHRLDWRGLPWEQFADLEAYVLLISGVPYSGKILSPKKMWIKLHDSVLDSSAVYTVSYALRTSDTHMDDDTLWLDSNKTIFLAHEGRVHFLKKDLDVTIDSDIYLQVTLRRNLASQASSPELLEYAVLGAVYN